MKKKQINFDTPVLLIIFNRPDVTKKLYQVLKKVKPRNLYIAADGPRKNKIGEHDVCNITRNIFEKVDWKCNIHKLYRKNNLGCGKSVSGAIDWFFKNEDRGIILEDDCLPHVSFFDFSKNMLDKYSNNDQIMHISGDNFLPINHQYKYKYYFSKYAHVWGWASWRRAWKAYDFKMRDWNNKSLFSKISSIEGNFLNKLYWTAKFDSVGYKMTNTWDYQLIYSIIKNNGVSIVPGVNLVSNIGFGSNSTHTLNDKLNHSDLTTNQINSKLNLADKKDIDSLEKFELDSVFKVNSLATVLHFAYFSIVCMIYIKLINYVKN